MRVLVDWVREVLVREVWGMKATAGVRVARRSVKDVIGDFMANIFDGALLYD